MNSRKSVFFIVLLLWTFLAFGLQSSPEHKLLFEKAKFTMETKADLKQAISLFKEIIEKYPEERQYAAKSLFYIGLCHEKLGHSEAVKAYEQLLQKYADQPEQVTAARARLTALRAEKPAGLTLTKIQGPEGRYIEPMSMSPDGTKLASVDFTKGQNIAVFDLVTHRLELVTHFDWDNVTYFPVWSPDGTKIAYVQYGTPTSIMASTLDGKAQLLYSSKESDPRPQDWLPDSSAVIVALIKGEDRSLGLVPAVGGDFKALHALQGDFHEGEFFAFADVSPDGRHIVFADGPKRGAQDIYCIGTDGQSLEVLTDHAANDIQPRWSPDGKHVAFLSFRSGEKALWGVSVKDGKSAGDPFIIKEMGEGTNLLNWTVRGLSYGYWIDMWDVFLMPVDPETGEATGKLQQLDYDPPGRNRSPVWSPDGKHIAFFSAGRGGQPGKGYVVVMPAGGGQAREFLIPWDFFRLYTMIDLRWMPDSSGLGFSGRNGKGSTLFRLTLATGEWETWPIPAEFWTRIEWGPSSNTYLYTKHGPPHIKMGEAGILMHNLETGQEHYVYQPEKGQGYVFRGLKFSRDYKKLAFEEDNNNIVVVDLQTGEFRTIASKGFSCPAWSADGQKIVVFRSMEGKLQEPPEMFIVPSEGGTLKKVALPEGQPRANYRNLDWAPDSKMIALGVIRFQYEIFVMKNVIPENQR